MMSEWESRRKRSPWYYLCLILLIWPFILIPLGQFVLVGLFSPSTLIVLSLCIILTVGLTYGCGEKYRYRGINPSSRNPMNYGDGHYFERIGSEESDYP